MGFGLRGTRTGGRTGKENERGKEGGRETDRCFDKRQLRTQYSSRATTRTFKTSQAKLNTINFIAQGSAIRSYLCLRTLGLQAR